MGFHPSGGGHGGFGRRRVDGGRSARNPCRGGLALALLAVLLTACAEDGGRGDRRPDILLVVIDALRADHLGCYGYVRETSPTIDRLAADGVVFDTAIATSSRTRTSMASLLTSLHPIEHGVRFPFRRTRGPQDVRSDGEWLRLIQGLADNLDTLAEVLAAAGYRTMAVVTNPYLKREHGFGQGFDTYVERELDADQVVEVFLEWRDGDPGGPVFAFLHFIDVHAPYSPRPPYDTRFVDQVTGLDPEARRKVLENARPESWNEFRRGVHSGQIELSGGALEILKGLYDGEIRWVDEALKRVVDRLQATGALESTLIVITADHGDEFLEHQLLGHGVHLYDGLIRVPLILRLPAAAAGGSRWTAPVSLIDVMPTVLDLSGVPVPANLSGRSLRSRILDDPPPPGEPPAVFSELIKPDYRKESIRTGRHKLIRIQYFGSGDPEEVERDRPATAAEVFRQQADPTRVEFELYDLVDDPGETRDLADHRPGQVAELRARLESHLQGLRPRVDLKPLLHEIDPETEERLRALGYLE
jgi:arylsulfatase A-like enzyme